MHKIKLVWFYSLCRNCFLSKTQWNYICAEYVLLFSEFHDVKTATSISCKNFLISSVHLHSIEKRETHNFNFHLNRIKLQQCLPMFFVKWLYAYWTLTISLFYPRTHSLSSFSPFVYMSWLSNKAPPAIFNNPNSLLLSMSAIF